MRLLSYPINAETPAYRDNPAPLIRPHRTFAVDGNAAHLVSFVNHTGTHLDVPAHFHPAGSRLGDLDLTALLFDRPLLLDVAVGDGDLIDARRLAAAAGPDIATADCLLVRTGYAAAVRAADPRRYGTRGPGFAADAAAWLRAHAPDVRAVLMDIISATAPEHPHEGRAFHLAALDEQGVRPILLVEDVRLDPDLTQEQLSRLLLAPLQLADLDGAPVTVVAGL